MNKRIFYILFTLFLFSCNTKNKDVKVSLKGISEEPVLSGMGGEFHSALEKVISNYIEEVDNNFVDKEWLYYNIYFFEQRTSKYFTIWVSTTYPSYISQCVDTSKYTFSLFDFENRKVVVISNKQYTNILFTFSEKSVLLARKENLKNYTGDIYDGSFYFWTYQVKKKNNDVKLVKLDTVISDFINCAELEIEELKP